MLILQRNASCSNSKYFLDSRNERKIMGVRSCVYVQKLLIILIMKRNGPCNIFMKFFKQSERNKVDREYDL